MAKKAVSVIILDLDNTLWDWVDIWYRSFRAELDKIVELSGIAEEDLYESIRAVHRKHHTSEYSFLIEELDILRQKHGPDAKLTELYAQAINSFREARRKFLVLYPTVFETLWAFRDAGCLVVGYTESQEFYTNYRLRRLGLDGLLDYVYSPIDHALPSGMTREELRTYRADTYEFKRTIHKYTPKGELKPNVAVLKSILADIGARPDQAVFIGDSVMKDIAMAQDCGVIDVHAKYGTPDAAQYDLLKAVTHWTNEDVAREAALKRRPEVMPTYVLDRSLSQVLDLFHFVPFGGITAEQVPHTLEMWKKAVDVQQHFNDLELRIRNFAISLLVAVIGATALLLKEPQIISIHTWPGIWLVLGLFVPVAIAVLIPIPKKTRRKLLWSRRVGIMAPALSGFVLTVMARGEGDTLRIPVATAVVAGGLLGWLAFYFMDRFWYHRLLMGAVKEGEDLETLLRPHIPVPGLTQRIGAASPFAIWGEPVHSSRKMDWFYMSIALLLGLLLLATALMDMPIPVLRDANAIHTEPAAQGRQPAAAIPKPGYPDSGQTMRSVRPQ